MDYTAGVHVRGVGRGPVVPVAEGIEAPVAFPLAPLRGRELLVLGRVEVGGLGDPAAAVGGDLSVGGAGGVVPVRGECGGCVGGAAVAPEDVGVVGIC